MILLKCNRIKGTGYEHKVPANYDRSDRARVIKAILTAYIENKYADKLKQHER